jgi:hypothetical protein
MAPSISGIYQPYRVVIVDNHVTVYPGESKIPVYTCKAVRVFVGTSLLNSMTDASGNYGRQFDGNTILVHEKELTYVSICEDIYRFRTLNPITEYRSPVGNNAVPYPYAIDSTGRCYLLIDNVILNAPMGPDPYEYFYHVSKLPGLQGYVDDGQHYVMRYHVDYRSTAMRLGVQAYIVRDNGMTAPLTPELYIALMQKYEKIIGATPYYFELLHDTRL